MSDDNPVAESSTPAFPGKVVVLYRDFYCVIGVLKDCRFERIAGRMFLVGNDVCPRFARQFPNGLPRAVAWDSPLAESFVLFDSLVEYERWEHATGNGEIPF